MIARYVNIDWQKCEGGWEVTLSVGCATPRRMAFCTHQGDAKDIAIALKSAHKQGMI